MARGKARTLALTTKVEVTGADKLKSLGDRLQNVGTKLTVGVTAPLAVLGATAVNAASELQQSTGAVESVFGKYGEAVEEFAQTSAESFGLSQRQVKEFGALLGAQLQSFGFEAGESAQMAVELQQRAADMAATFGGTVPEAVQAISSLMRGERNPIERYGVALKQADIEARILALGLDTSTTEAKKQAEAIAGLDLLYEQTAKTQGQFARESDTLAGSQARLSAKWEDVQAQIGEKLLPVMVGIAEAVAGILDAFSELPDGVQTAIVAFGGIAAAAGPVLLVVGSITKAVGGIKTAFLGMKAIPGLLAPIAGKIGAALTLMTGPIGVVVAAIAGLAALWVTDMGGIQRETEITNSILALHFGDLGDKANQLAEDTGRSFDEIKQAVHREMEETGDSVEQVLRRMERGYEAMTDAQWDAVEESGNAWAANRNAISDAMYGPDGMVPTIEGGADAMAQEMGEAPGKMADELLANQFELDSAIDELVRFMDEALSPAQEVFNARAFLASQEYRDGLNSGIPSVREKAKELGQEAQATIDRYSNGYGSGQKLSSSFAAGMVDPVVINYVKQSAYKVALAARGIFPSSEPKDPSSPFRGITKGFGFGQVLAKGLLSGQGAVQGAFRSLVGEGLSLPNVSSLVGSGPAPQLAAAGDTHFHFHVEGPLSSERERGIEGLVRQAMFSSGFTDRGVVR